MIINYSVNNNSGGGNGFSLESLGFPPFDTATFYKIGQVVIYNNSLYQFTENHIGEWDDDDAAETTVEELINEAGLSFEKLGFSRFSVRANYQKGDIVIYLKDGADVLFEALVNGASNPSNPSEFKETSVAELIKNSGGGSAEGAVRYDEAQDLTEEQQAQARDNIGAPGCLLIELEEGELEDMTVEEFRSIYGLLSQGHEVFVFAGRAEYKLLTENLVTTRNYDDLFLYFLNYDGTIEEICLHDHYNPEIEFRKLGTENHHLLREELSEAMGCQADTWHTLAEVEVPEDGVYQVSASVRVQPGTESTYSAVLACIDVFGDGKDPTEYQEIQLPRSDEYGTMAVPIEALRGQKIRLRAYSSSNFYAQASPSDGKAPATFIAAVRIGAIYQE